ncbi:HET-domain-containing protein [Aspergillus pseudocaelatus]|uniref:HET-domain-containing protein n=1 Tax=Aspergillus pseudocaelatus TaxID=1825620 RepID=A0ABQ6X165_9EURO|nr:HET-domain-containing protein [Aspergillus pseudocaelatus]
MRLLNTNTCRLRDPVYDSIPDYAILSHRWGAAKDEVTFEEIEQADHKDFEARPGYRKIQNCCAQAKSVGLENVWVDTCCIKKSSTAELTAALNSMFHWYRNAQVCYCYLADVPSNENPSIANSSFRRSNWFKRGWTLQELLAPLHVVFFAEDWKVLGTKASLQSVISEITGLSSQILLMNHGGEISVAERMSWAANRETAQVEDKAYCLMGLFGVSMPMMYGEGEKAFERLQLEIMKVSDDQSLFAWVRNDSLNRKTGLLARSPSEFRDSANISMRNGPSLTRTPS